MVLWCCTVMLWCCTVTLWCCRATTQLSSDCSSRRLKEDSKIRSDQSGCWAVPGELQPLGLGCQVSQRMQPRVVRPVCGMASVCCSHQRVPIVC